MGGRVLTTVNISLSPKRGSIYKTCSLLILKGEKILTQYISFPKTQEALALLARDRLIFLGNNSCFN